MGTKGTNSNIEWQLQNSDTGGHETNCSSQREDVARGFSVIEEGFREKVAGCCDDKFGDCVGPGENCSQGGSSERKPLNSHPGLLNPLDTLEPA